MTTLNEPGHYDVYDPKVGAIVYPAYEPNRVGKVVGVKQTNMDVKPGTYWSLTVRTAKGDEYSTQNLSTNCFRCLVAGHERKAKNQGAKLKEAEAV